MQEELKEKPKIIIIVGPTASGKTSLSIEIAEKYGGEIVSADSRQVYKGLDLGTGKVTKEEMHGVPHHLLDVADPEDTYTVSEYVRDGRTAIADILARGRLPIVVGGTFFYIDALIGRVAAPDVPPNPVLREKLEQMSADALYTVLLQNDERRAMDIDPHNKRRLIRALEVVEALGKVPEQQSELLFNALTIGIELRQEELHQNIHHRLLSRIELGMIHEVKQLYENGLSYERMEELGLEYRYISRYLQGQLEKEAMLEELETKIRQFAKRQMTWLKRDAGIEWFKPEEREAILKRVSDFLTQGMN